MPLKVAAVQNLALRLPSHQYTSMQDKIALLKYLSTFSDTESELSDKDWLKLKMLDRHLSNTINPDPATVLYLMSAHFNLVTDIKRSQGLVLFIGGIPKSNPDTFFDVKQTTALVQVLDLTRTITKVPILPIIYTMFGAARVMWYNPFSMQLSLKYIEDSDWTLGYEVREFDELIDMYNAAKIHKVID